MPQRRELVAILAVTLLAPGAALIAGCICDAGREAAPAFFATVAQIAPVFALALFLEVAVVMGAAIQRDGLTSGNQATTRFLVVTNSLLLLEAETASLYATAARVQTTFLIGLSVAPLMIQLVLLADTAHLRAGVSRIRGG